MHPLHLVSSSLVLATAVLQPPAQAQVKRFVEAHSMFPAYNTGPEAFAGADVDGDGDRDLVSTADSVGKRLILNDGTGSFADATSKLGPQLFSDDGAGVALADVDGDGDADALFANDQDDNSLLLNSGDGTFADASHLLPPPTSGVTDFSVCVALGDVSGDGLPDALLGNRLGHENRLWFNEGSGSFFDVGLTPTWGDPREVLLADVDGDGDLDAILAGAVDILLRNHEFGTFFTVPGAIPSPVASTSVAAEVGDVDADGDADLLTVVHNKAFLFHNGGTGLFADASGDLAPIVDTPETSFRDAALRDLDGDGDLDALLMRGGSFDPLANDYLFLNDGQGLFEDASELLEEIPHLGGKLYADDLDGDADVDVVLGLYSQSRLLLNDGAGGLHDVTRDWPDDALPTMDVALGDIDADGDPDVLMANLVTSSLLLNDGRGDFEDATAGLGFALQAGQVALLGDVDGDGADDVLLCDAADSLHLADGQGGLLPASPGLPADGTSTVDGAFIDSDSDGDLDVLLLPLRHYRNDGAGGFTHSAADTPATPTASSCLATGDVDGDGDLDALIGITTSTPVADKLLLNDGAGVFSLAVGALPAHADFSLGAALTDVDGDGDLDALLANGLTSATDRLYANSGSGVFTDATSQLPAGSKLAGAEIVARDFDEDGDADVLGNGAFWTNDGAGFFADATSSTPLTQYEVGLGIAFAAGDVDGDDDLDVVAGEGAEAFERLYTNVTRQVTRTTLPRVGKPYTLAVHGKPQSPFFFAWGTTPAEIPLPPFGILRLSPAALLVIDSSGLIPASGQLPKTFQAPSDPIWAGVTIYWQALVGTPLFFTNLEPTTLSAL